MAKSPSENAGSSDILRYDLGWKAINDLLAAGRSLSGRERNSFFLNLGQKEARFADASSALKLDFPDDGRVLALSDWDFDGDIDFWIANRSGPQVRFLKNEAAPGNAVLFRLFAKTGNRDAIGSRVTIVMADGSRQTQTLRAGEGYLSQHSKWIHFGTGGAETISKVSVRWPHGEIQEFRNLKSVNHYLLFEGKADASLWKTPKVLPLVESPITSYSISDKARLRLLQPLPLPALGGLSEGIKKARLVNLWLSTCPNCLAELSEWTDHTEGFQKAGLEVVAVNVDEKEDRSTWTTPFDHRFGSPQLVEKFDVLQRSILSRQRPLPVPSSFLIDSQGQLRAVYKGPVSSEQILSDVALIDAPPAKRLAAATPFPGRWNIPPNGSDPQHIALKFMEGGYLEEAEDYIVSLTKNSATSTAPIFNLLGALNIDQKKYSEAANAFRNALTLDPENRKSHSEMALLYLAANRGKEAEFHLRTVLKHDVDDPELLLQLAKALKLQDRIEEAKAVLQSAPQNPEIRDALKNL